MEDRGVTITPVPAVAAVAATACAPRMKPVKKMTATMKTTPATMPTHAATAVSLDRRGGSAW